MKPLMCHHPDCGLPQGECTSRDCLRLSLHRAHINTDFVQGARAVHGQVEQRPPTEPQDADHALAAWFWRFYGSLVTAVVLGAGVAHVWGD